MKARASSYGFQSSGGSGGGGGSIVDTGSYSSPQTIVSNITVPTDQRARIYVVGSGAVVDPTIGSGSGTHELYIIGTSDTNTVQLDNKTNLFLNGTIVIGAKSLLSLQWVSGLSAWLEVSRNEII